MKVWHGSYTTIEKIDLAFCEKGKDFGRGFYVTNLLEQARDYDIVEGLRRRRIDRLL
jgi:hypothetical protein